MTEYIEREKAMQIAFTSPFFSDTLMEEIEAIPSADVAPVVHGQWECGCQCSVCGDSHGPYNSRHRPYYNYCPNCGAKMDEEGHDG